MRRSRPIGNGIGARSRLPALVLTASLILVGPLGCEKTNPQAQHAELLERAGEALARGDHAAALEHAESAVALQPERASGHLAMGNICFELGRADPSRYAQAERSYRRVLALEPDNARAWVGSGFALRATGSPREADRCFAHAIERYQRDLARWSELAGPESPLDRTIDLREPMTRVYVAALTALRGDREAALAQLDMIEDRHPRYAGVPFWRGVIARGEVEAYLLNPEAAMTARDSPNGADASADAAAGAGGLP